MVLVTLDAKALYTNIPYEEAWEVIEDVLESCSYSFPHFFSLDLLDIILEKNYFQKGDFIAML